MNCGQFEEWLFLHRPGELSQTDLAALEVHLRGCPRCSALRERLASDDQLVARIRAMAPEPRDVDASAERILVAIRDGERAASPSEIRKFLDILFLSFRHPGFRIASAFLSLAIIGSLLYQQFSLMNDVSRLEARMAVSQHQAGMIQTAFALDSTAVSQIPRSREILKALGDRVSADRERNILIKRNRALSLNEASVRTMLVRRRITGSAALDARTIEEIFRGVRRHANLVFRLSKKGGVG